MMTHAVRLTFLALLGGALLGLAGCGTPDSSKDKDTVPVAGAEGSAWRQEFTLTGRTLVSTGRNPYFVLEPGFQLELRGEDGKLVVTVLDETETIGGIRTRVVEEREWRGGELIEVSRNFFAMDGNTKDVFYFGESVDTYEDGTITGHPGSWRAGEAGARAGLMMPGVPEVGSKDYQEVAPGVAMDRAEVVGLHETFQTPAGAFDDCLKTREGTALNPKEEEFKLYAPGIGLIQDEDLVLVRYGFGKE